MKIHRYIYTRLSKEASPTGKSGFQSAFLPGDLLASKEVLEIESHIHFPEGLQEATKSVVLHKQVKGELYLVLLLLRALPEVKDEHGRGGTFLCEGFLIAEADWRPIKVVSELTELVAPHRFAGLDALLASPDVDRKTGRISGLDLPFEPAKGRRLDEDDDEPSPEFLMAIYHVVHTQNRDLAVVLQGTPAQVSEKFEICSTFLPDALRPLMSWDDAFDGGKIFFSPMRIFGYSDLVPVTGGPVLFSNGGKEVIWPDDGVKRFGQPQDPYGNWLLEVCVSPVPRERLNQMYALSNAMVSKSPASPDMPSDPLFETVNKVAIADLFLSGLVGVLGERWTIKVRDVMSPAEQLQCWMKGFPMTQVTHHLEQAMLLNDLNPEVVKEAPSAKVVAQGSGTLQLMAAMWTRKVPEAAVLDQIPENKIIDCLALVLGRGAHTDFAFLPVLAQFQSLLPTLPDSDRIKQTLRVYVEHLVPKTYQDLKHGLVEVTVDIGQLKCFVAEEADWLALLNFWFAATGGDAKAWKAMKKFATSPEIRPYPNLVAFAEGETLPRELERKGRGRTGYLQALVDVHGLKQRQLLDLGFFAAEISEAGGKGGLFSKIKRLFRR